MRAIQTGGAVGQGLGVQVFTNAIKAVRETPSYFWAAGIIATAIDAWWDGWFK
jgi:hypothetical protein